MRKVVTAVLLLFIIAIFSYIVIRVSANSLDENSWFNRSWREVFARHPFARNIFSLHWDGDAAADYLSPQRFSSLRVEIDRYENCFLSNTMLQQVQAEIEEVTGRSGTVTVEESNVFVLSKEGYTRKEIREVAERYQNFTTSGDTAALYILCLNTYQEQPSNIGLTVHEDGIVIFWQTMQELARNNPATLEPYVVSTILHEFGHQIELPHVADQRCLMDQSVERPGKAAGALQLIPVTFCQEEREMIQQAMSALR